MEGGSRSRKYRSNKGCPDLKKLTILFEYEGVVGVKELQDRLVCSHFPTVFFNVRERLTMVKIKYQGLDCTSLETVEKSLSNTLGIENETILLIW